MKKLPLIILAAGLSLFVACSDDDDDQVTTDTNTGTSTGSDSTTETTGPSVVTISPLVYGASSATFADGDQLGLTIVYGSTTYADNACLAYADGVFTSSLTWEDEGEYATLTAYSPYSDSGIVGSFTVATDQSASGAYVASDLISSTVTGVVPSADAVVMSFSHLLSNLDISITNDSGSTITSVVLQGSIPTATVDSDLVATVSSTDSAVDITAQVDDETNYNVVIVPQTAALTLAVTTEDGKTKTATLESATYEAGQSYIVSAELSQVYFSATVTGSITGWTSGGTIAEASND